jgi:hypothetical protein
MTIVSPGSRYSDPTQTDPEPPARYRTASGREVMYRRRRLLPQGTQIPAVDTVVATEGERLDRLANRVFGDPLQAWRIADANDAMRPQELLAVPGRRLRIPLSPGDLTLPLDGTS